MMVILSSTLVKVLVTSYRVGFYAELYGFMLDNSRRESPKDAKPPKLSGKLYGARDYTTIRTSPLVSRL